MARLPWLPPHFGLLTLLAFRCVAHCCHLPIFFLSLCLWTSLFILQWLYIVGWWPAEQCREDWHWSAFLGNLFLQQSNIQRCFRQSSESCGRVEPSFILESSPVGCYSRSAGKIRPVILEKSQSSREKMLTFLLKHQKRIEPCGGTAKRVLFRWSHQARVARSMVSANQC